jgi:bleomycin hydrolase
MYKSLIKNTKMASKAAGIEIEALSEWTKEFKTDLKTQIGASVLQHSNIDEVLVNRDQEIADKNVFNHKIEIEGTPVMDQKASGRCWLFASTNMLRVVAMKKYNMKEIKLSPSYLFFYDKLERANYFLEQIIDTHNEPVDSRLIQWFLTNPVEDGGQFTMMASIADKYGIVPDQVFPDSFNTTTSRIMNRMLNFKLREFAMTLRNALDKGEDITETKKNMQKEVYRLLTMFLGNPPKPEEEFTWEFYDKDGKYNSVTTTPRKYSSEVLDFNSPEFVSLLNDPRNEYNKMIKVDRLGNIANGNPVTYLNLEAEKLSQAVINRIKNNKPVFFGNDTPKFMDKKRGLLDTDLWDFKLLGYDHESMSKKDRVLYGDSLMTHAMLITGVHVDENGKAVRYRVENSWGTKSGQDGYYVMTEKYFQEYVYQVVVEKEELAALGIDASILESKDQIVLPPYDPMGALAL